MINDIKAEATFDMNKWHAEMKAKSVKKLD